MCWLLAACCGLALISISAALYLGQKPVAQVPRFVAVKTSRNVTIICAPTIQTDKVKWFKAEKYSEDNMQYRREIKEGKRITFRDTLKKGKYLIISEVGLNDSGVYYCKSNDSWGPGSEVQVVRAINPDQVLHRTRMKDGLMILQGLLLAVCIAALMLRKRQLLKKKDSIYEEPETDHIYEGLAIETCGGGLYEELSLYAQAEGVEGAEAPWE